MEAAVKQTVKQTAKQTASVSQGATSPKDRYKMLIRIAWSGFGMILTVILMMVVLPGIIPYPWMSTSLPTVSEHLERIGMVLQGKQARPTYPPADEQALPLFMAPIAQSQRFWLDDLVPGGVNGPLWKVTVPDDFSCSGYTNSFAQLHFAAKGEYGVGLSATGALIHISAGGQACEPFAVGVKEAAKAVKFLWVAQEKRYDTDGQVLEGATVYGMDGAGRFYQAFHDGKSYDVLREMEELPPGYLVQKTGSGFLVQSPGYHTITPQGEDGAGLKVEFVAYDHLPSESTLPVEDKREQGVNAGGVLGYIRQQAFERKRYPDNDADYYPPYDAGVPFPSTANGLDYPANNDYPDYYDNAAANMPQQQMQQALPPQMQQPSSKLPDLSPAGWVEQKALTGDSASALKGVEPAMWEQRTQQGTINISEPLSEPEAVQESPIARIDALTAYRAGFYAPPEDEAEPRVYYEIDNKRDGTLRFLHNGQVVNNPLPSFPVDAVLQVVDVIYTPDGDKVLLFIQDTSRTETVHPFLGGEDASFPASPVRMFYSVDGGKSYRETPPYAGLSVYGMAIALLVGMECLFLLMIAGLYYLSRRRPKEAPLRDPMRAAFTDRPMSSEDVDVTGAGALARAVSLFIRNTDTSPPITFGIRGQWGCGKSSVMCLLQEDLERYGTPVVWFNAWHHQTEEHLLAALLANIRAQALKPWYYASGMLFWLRLLWSRRGKLVPALIVCIAIGLFIWRLPLDIDASLQLLLSFAPAAFLAPKLKIFSSLRLLVPGGNFRFMKLEEKFSFRHRFNQEFSDMCTLLRDHYGGGLTVIIDDLDRCSPGNVQLVTEAINFLVNAGECFVVIGYDEEKTAAAIGRTFEYETLKDAEYGKNYLKKIINIPVNVPTLPPQNISTLLNAAPDNQQITQKQQVNQQQANQRQQRRSRWSNAVDAALGVALAVFILYGILVMGDNLRLLAQERETITVTVPTEPVQAPAEVAQLTFDPSRDNRVPVVPDAPMAGGELSQPQGQTKSEVKSGVETAPSSMEQFGRIKEGYRGDTVTYHPLSWWQRPYTLSMGMSAILFTVIVIGGLFLLLNIRKAVLGTETHDDPVLRLMIAAWAQIVCYKHNTPREAKRFGNYARFMLARYQEGLGQGLGSSFHQHAREWLACAAMDYTEQAFFREWGNSIMKGQPLRDDATRQRQFATFLVEKGAKKGLQNGEFPLPGEATLRAYFLPQVMVASEDHTAI